MSASILLRAFVAACLCAIGAHGIQIYEAERQLKGIFQQRDYQRYHYENVVNVSSWSASQFTAREICKYMQELKPKIMGFQGVTKEKVKELSDCLGRTYHYFMGESTGAYRNEVYNPIFFEKSRYLKPYYRKSGTFWLSDTPTVQGSTLINRWGQQVTPRACTWIKINFLQKTSEFRQLRRTNRFKILNLLKVFAGKLPNRAPVARSPLPKRLVRQHKWTTIYVANTQLDNRDEKIAMQQMAIMKKHTRAHRAIMDRRRYAFVMMADLGWNHDSRIYKASQEDGWLIDSLKYSVLDSNSRSDNRNFIMRSRLKSLMGTTITNSDWSSMQDLPVFAAYLSERSPKKSRENDASRNIVTRE